MSKRKIMDAQNPNTGEKIYFKSHAEATYMSDGRTVEDAIPTKVSQLENDKNYIENGDGYNSGVYIAVQSGKLINPDEYDSTTETAVGVAVIDPKANFIIGLNQTASIPWGTSSQGLYGADIPGLTNCNNSTAAKTDTNGVANTNAITAIYSDTNCAAGLAKSQSITYGNNSLTGYLGSAGEWQIVLNNGEAVKSAMVIAGGNCFQVNSTSLYYWSSTEYSSYYAWAAHQYWSGTFASSDYISKDSAGSSYCVVPFYKIDNETTLLSKILSDINLISTPAGSSTAPIYIDSNGNIASTIYGGGTKVTLNGSAKGGSTASFYAPTSAGTSGQVLTSNGSGAPSWTTLSVLKPIETVDGTSVVTLNSTKHLIIDNFTSSKLYRVTSSDVNEEFSFEFKCLENFDSLIAFPSVSWINLPDTFVAGKSYVGSIQKDVGIILEYDAVSTTDQKSAVTISATKNSVQAQSTNVVIQIKLTISSDIFVSDQTNEKANISVSGNYIQICTHSVNVINGVIPKGTYILNCKSPTFDIVSTSRPSTSTYNVTTMSFNSAQVNFFVNTPQTITKSGGLSVSLGYTYYGGTRRSSQS